jgi:D-amino-acid dehydrogenase
MPNQEIPHQESSQHNKTAPIPPRRIVVVGAGVVGVTTALRLQHQGHSVLILDPSPPGTNTSFGNAGSISMGGVYPTSTPGNWKQVPKMLADPASPMRIHWDHVLKHPKFFMRFLREGTPSRVEANSLAMAGLAQGAVDAHKALIKLAKADGIVRPVGWLKVYSSRENFEKTAEERAVMARRGVNIDVLNADELRQLEPGISPRFTHGWNQPDNAFVSSPLKLTEAYFAEFRRLGGEWRAERVQRFVTGPNGVESVNTLHGIHACDAVVIATGARAGELSELLGDRTLIGAERGYHLNMQLDLEAEGGEVPLRRPTVFGDLGFVLAPMQDGLRLTTGSEFSEPDSPPDFRRIYRMAKLVEQALPGVKPRVDREWMGQRPSTPDSVPTLGRSPRHGNVWYNFGHGHLGLTMSAKSAEVTADLIAGRDPGLDMAPYRIDRFT